MAVLTNLRGPYQVERSMAIRMKKKIIGKIIICLAGLLALFVYYYVTIPAINIHSTGTWGALFLLVLLLLSFCIFRQFKKDRQTVVEGENIFRFNLKESSLAVKALAGLLILLGLVYLTGALLSSPFFNAAKYQRLLSIEEREFTDDIKQVDYKTKIGRASCRERVSS